MIVTCSWIFNVFDEDGGGTIDKEEVTSGVTNDYVKYFMCQLIPCPLSYMLFVILAKIFKYIYLSIYHGSGGHPALMGTPDMSYES